MKRVPAVTKAALAAMTLTVLGCGRPPSAPQSAAPPAVEVVLGLVVRLPVERTLEITGTLYGYEEATLSAKVGGRVSEVVRDLNDEALSGAPVVQIDTTDLGLEVATRRAALAAALAKLGLDDVPPEPFDIAQVPTVGRALAEEANARARLQRARELFEQTPPLIAEQEFADIQTQADVAQWSARVEALTAGATLAEARAQAAQLAAAEQRLADATVRAPSHAGGEPVRYRVSERLVSVGELVTPGQPLARVVATDVLEFRGQVPEREAGRVAAGQRVRVTVEAYPEPVEGVVSRVSPAVDALSRTFRVEIEIQNPTGLIKPGGFARAAIVTGTEQDVPHVPEAAVASFAGVQRVFAVEGDKAVGVVVTTGDTRDGLVELVGEIGVERVVVQGVTGLSGGREVRVVSELTRVGGQ